MTQLLGFAIASIMLLAILTAAVLSLRPDAKQAAAPIKKLRIYCAASVALPLEAIIDSYKDEFDVEIELARTGGSGELAGQIKTEFESGLKNGCDLFLTADDELLSEAFNAGIVSEQFPIATQTPVIATGDSCETKLNSIQSLTNHPNLKFGIASKRAAIGRLTRAIADRQGILEQLERLKKTDSENVMTLAQAVAVGSLDAAVVWDTTVNQLNRQNGTQQLKIACEVKTAKHAGGSIAVGIIGQTDSPMAARRFCGYLSDSETSKNAFQKFGFCFIQDDQSGSRDNQTIE